MTFQSKPLEAVTSTIIDYRGKTPPKADRGIKLLTAKVIKGGGIDKSRLEYISEETYQLWMRRGFPKQFDILITTEAPLGEVAILRSPERVALAQRVILLRGNPDIVDQQYLFVALRSPLVQGRLRARASGTTVSGIKQSELRQVEIPLPPLGHQRRIGAVIAAYDELIENCERRMEILEEEAHAIYRTWFVDLRFPGAGNVAHIDTGAGPVPEGWHVAELSQQVAVDPSTPLPKSDSFPFVPMTSLAAGSMLVTEVDERAPGGGLSRFIRGDTLLPGINPSLQNGKTAFVQFLNDDQIGLGSTEFIVLRSMHLSPEWVYCFARTDAFRETAIKSMTGASGRQRVKKDAVRSYPVVVPPSDLVEGFTAVVQPMFALIEVLRRANQNLRATRTALLPKLITGEIDTSDIEIDMSWVAA